MRRRLAFALLLPLTACAAGPGEFVRRPPQPIGWPPAPQPARVTCEFTFHGSDDVVRHPGLFATLTDWLAGSDEPALASPTGLCFGSDDALWIADAALAVVHRLSLRTGAHTVLTGSAERPLGIPIGVAEGPDGRVYVTDSQRAHVLVFASGAPVATIGDGVLERPTGIVWDAARARLLVTDTTAGRVLAFAPDGSLLAKVGSRGQAPGEFNCPTNVALAPDGSVLVTDSMNFRVQVLDAELRPVRTIGAAGRGPGTFSSPKGLAADADGQVWVVDAMFDNVQVFTPDGQLLLAVGGSGTGHGEFHLPSGIAMAADGRIAIADAGNARIQLLRYHPQP